MTGPVPCLSSPWLRTMAEPERSLLDLYCFPHAGGAADSYAAWAEVMVKDYPVALHAVQLPGRRERFDEPPVRDIAAAADVLAPLIEQHRGRPMLFFGHSLGALIAFETALRLERQRRPITLIAAACSAPSRRRRAAPIHRLPSRDFLERIGEFGGTPAEILSDTALMALFEPTLRADFALAENYRCNDGTTLSIPIVAWGGTSDTAVEASDITAWRACTTGPCRTESFAGGHFFPHEALEPFQDALRYQLINALGRMSTSHADIDAVQ